MSALEQAAHGPAAVSPSSQGAVINPLIRRLLEAPVLPTLLRLAFPNLAEAVARVAFITLDGYFVGWLGYDALAGVSLVFPLWLLMQTISAGAMGSGISSAIARSLGAGRQGDANALVMHAVAIGLVLSGLFTLLFVPLGPALYAAMGGVGPALEAASTYSTVIFLGGIFIWMMNTLANVLRGTGNMVIPASAIVIAELVHVTVSPVLILGLGPVPRLGVAGAALAILSSYLAGTLVLLIYLASGRAIVRFSWTTLQWQRRLFADILKVGGLSSLTAIQAQATNIALAAMVGHFGTAAIAGFGAALRLEQLQLPIIFALGSAVVAMVGANMGAGRRARGAQIAWTGAAIAAVISGAIGLFGAVFAANWIGWFSGEPAVVEVGSLYLHLLGPVYPFLGVGLVLFSASQGVGKVVGPFLCATMRLIIVAAGGWLVVNALGAGLHSLFAVAAVATVVLGVSVAAVFKWLIVSPAR